LHTRYAETRRMIGCGTSRGQLLFETGCRDYLPDETLRGVFQDTGGQTVCRIADDDPAVRILRGAGDVRELQRQTVSQGHMPVETIHKHGCVRCVTINQLPGW